MIFRGFPWRGGFWGFPGWTTRSSNQGWGCTTLSSMKTINLILQKSQELCFPSIIFQELLLVKSAGGEHLHFNKRKLFFVGWFEKWRDMGLGILTPFFWWLLGKARCGFSLGALLSGTHRTDRCRIGIAWSAFCCISGWGVNRVSSGEAVLKRKQGAKKHGKNHQVGWFRNGPRQNPFLPFFGKV